MSATLNAEQVSEYFNSAPMTNIPGFTYPVTEHYLEDIIDLVKYVRLSMTMINATCMSILAVK